MIFFKFFLNMSVKFGEPKTITELRESLTPRGWRVEYKPYRDFTIVSTVEGQTLSCMDPRRDQTTVPNLLGPAIPGGVIGLATFLKGMSFERRVGKAVDLIEKGGFKAGTHGDLDHGDIQGCKYMSALSTRMLDEFVPEEEIRRLILAFGINHHMLRGTGDPKGVLLNHKEGTAVIPVRSKYVIDTWLLDAIGVKPASYVEALDRTGRMLLPPQRRTLIIPR